MATVPNCDMAIVEAGKVSDYLLSETHPIGRTKARFFRRFGFRADVPEEFAQAMLDHVRDNAVADIEMSPYGAKYRVDGPLTSPGGKPTVSTIWMILNGQTTPRFVTAFPC